MKQSYSTLENPLIEGIKVIGIGKHGSKALPESLLNEILAYLPAKEIVPIQKGAFYGALMAKGATEAEQALLPKDISLYDWLCPDAPPSMKEIGEKLLNKEFLDFREAQILGDFLFSSLPGESFRGMAASLMRIRYETLEEYHGLMKAAEATFTDVYNEQSSRATDPGAGFPAASGTTSDSALDTPAASNKAADSSIPSALPLIQLAEPFDGVIHSYMITPLLAAGLQRAGYRVLVSMGRTAGPKRTLNTLDLYQALDAPTSRQTANELREFKKSKEEDEFKVTGQAANAAGQAKGSSRAFAASPGSATPGSAASLASFGLQLNQQILSPALDQWVERRHLILKRPFLATLEKVLNPCKADILITSVFHITYMEKMVSLAGMAGFSGVIVLKRGLEGTLAPSLAKASGILCAARQADGSFLTQTYDAAHDDFSDFRAETDENIEDLQLSDNLKLILHYKENGFSPCEDFDKRVGLAMALYQKGLKWIQENSLPAC